MEENVIKLGAILARVSTSSQHETSIPSQVERSRAKAESMGFIIPAENILTTDRTSLELNNDPKFQILYNLVVNRKINSIFLLDRDRLQADPMERLSFISLCRENRVDIIPCQGPELLDSDEGMILEHVLAISKKKQVLRAQLGSKTGLHDRVVLHRKPPTFRKPYGYTWEKETRTLLPDENWQNVKVIFDLLLEGLGYDRVISELKRYGICSPSGQIQWNKNGISGLLHNPLYAGRYFALKKDAITPKKRRGDTHGKTSCAKRPELDWCFLPEIKIVNPPITWEQRQQLLAQVGAHMKLSRRHAKRDYLLRGFIHCSEHVGKNGRAITYHGSPRRDTYYYGCTQKGCYHRNLRGPELEDYVKNRILLLLATQPGKFYKLADNGTTKKSIENELINLSKKRERIISKMTRNEDEFFDGKILPEIHENLKESYNFELAGIEKRRDVLLTELNQLNREHDAMASIDEIRVKYAYLIVGLRCPTEYYPERVLTNTQWREIFTVLGLEITPCTREERENKIINACAPDGALDVPLYEQLLNSTAPQFGYDINVKVNVPLTVDKVNSIALASPWNGKPNTYPIYLTQNYNSNNVLSPMA